MGLRPGQCYSRRKDRAYSRLAVKVHRRNYIGTAPGLRTRQFNMGNATKNYDTIVDLMVDEKVTLRDNALEAIRIMVTRYLTTRLGKENFFLKIRVYPHHILRENKMAQGAHADRIQQGMSHAFGKPIGRALRVRVNQKIASVLVDSANTSVVKNGLKRAFSKLPCKAHVRVGTDVASIGTRPRKMKEIAEEETAKEEGKEEKKEGKEAKEEGKAEKKSEGKEKKEEGKAEKGKKEEPKKEQKADSKGKTEAKGKGKGK